MGISKPLAEDPLNPSETLLRISELLGAHHRLTVGFSFLVNLMKPAPLSALADFTGFKVEVFENLLNSDLEEVLDKLMKVKTENLKIDDALKAVEVIRDMEDLLEIVPPVSNESVKWEAKEKFKEWMKYSTVDLTVLEGFSYIIKDLSTFYDEPTDGGLPDKPLPIGPYFGDKIYMEPLRKFPEELENLVRKLKTLPEILYFESIFLPIRMSLVAIESMQKSRLTITNEASSRIAQILSEFPAGMLNGSAKAVTSLLTLPDSEESPINRLSQDLDGVYLKECLAEGNELTILKKVFEPIFKAGTAFDGFLRDVQEKMEFLENDCKKVNELLEKLMDTEGSGRFQSDLKAINSINTTMALESTIRNFQNLFKLFSDGLYEYRQLQKDILEFEKSADYKIASKVSGLEREIEKALDIILKDDDFKMFNELKKNETFINLKNSFENSVEKLKEFNKKAQKVNDNFKKIDQWEVVVNDSEKLVKEFLKSKHGNLRMEAGRVKGTLEFIKSLQAKDLDFDEFNKKLKDLKTSVRSNLKIIEEEYNFKNLTDFPTYHEISKFQEPSLAEKLANGEFLFGLFHKFLTEEDSFKEVFKAISQVGYSMNMVSYENNNRYKILEILEKLSSKSLEIDKMKSEILKRKERYDGKSNEELIDLRWLVENLHEVLSPEYRVSELLDFSKILPDELSPKSFETSVNSTFDLDFAQYQMNLKDTYRPLTGLRLLHQNIVAHELLSQRPSFWEENFYWLIPVMIVVALGLGGIAICVLCKCRGNGSDRNDDDSE